jgi:predicted ATPase
LISNNDSASDFIGRKPEMGELTAALNNALSGRGQVVMLAGEPGSGKTWAANELAALAETNGFRVMRGWCYEHGGAPALWPWLQCIRGYIKTLDSSQLRREMGPGAADISEVVPELTAKLDGLEPPPILDPAQARFRLFFSITNFLKSASQTRPMLLVLDDLHWADESSVLLLEFLTKEIAASSLMVVGTFRDGEITGRHLSRTLGELVRERHFHRVHLEGLSREGVGEFIGSRSGIDVPRAAVDTLHERTGENPLFVSEVVSSVSPEEIALDQDWVSTIPEAVRDAILRRLSGLSDSCNQLLRTASVMGSEFELSSLQQQASEIDEDAFPESLNEALASRIIGPLGPGTGR